MVKVKMRVCDFLDGFLESRWDLEIMEVKGFCLGVFEGFFLKIIVWYFWFVEKFFKRIKNLFKC